MLRICPGYRPADGDESVARARRVKRRPRGAERTVQQSFPEAMLRICPGYRPANGDEPVARARRVKRRPREQSAQCSRVSRRRCCASVRATGPQTVMNL
ncbi:hypothetical protein E5Q62_11465 [Klebsiella oxytoca]|nr:hypothetical protein [Klebsiella oxytoca]TGN45695.1 hypothetical protein E5Q62_11465 [Klebsiella oxytoca]